MVRFLLHRHPASHCHPSQQPSPQPTTVTPAKPRHPRQPLSPQRNNVTPAEAGTSLTHSVVRTPYPNPTTPKILNYTQNMYPHKQSHPQHQRGITITNNTHHKKISLPTSGLPLPASYKTHKAAQVGLSWKASQTMGRAVRQATE
jgi:hypothetical protein